MVVLGPTLETARLILRPPAQADFEAWAAFQADPQNTRHIGGALARDPAWRGMASIAGSWALLGYGMFSVIEKASGAWIGRLGPWRPGGATGGWPGDEIGWALIPPMQARGYATEGAAAAMDWAADVLGWNEIVHCIAPENAPSQAVARRLGARILRTARLPAPIDVVVDVWGQSAEAWRARRRAG